MSRERLLTVVTLAALPYCAGCGSGDLVSVSGAVTLDGKPMPGIQVMFDQPELGPNENKGYAGTTDEQGRYALRPLIGDGTGAPPGDYRVSLTTIAPDPNAPPAPRPRPTTIFSEEAPPPPPERVPPAYRGGKLTFTVPEGGTDAANFDLKSR